MKKLLPIYLIIITFIITSCQPNDRRINPSSDVITIDSLKINRKVLVVGIDGFRSDIMTPEITPFINSLSQKNNTYFTLDHITEEITYSGPNWSSMLTGVHMDKHNVIDNSFDNNSYNYYPSFFHYIEKANPSINTASIVNWIPINTHLLSNHTDHYNTETMNDSTVFEFTKNLLTHNFLPMDVVFVQLDELDGAGHSYGFHPTIEEYTNTANKIDEYTEMLFNIVQNKRASGEDWLFFVISDHGGEETSHSDGSNPNINQTIFFAEHPDLQFKANCCYTSSQVDLAPTILDFIGISSTYFEATTDGVSVLEPKTE